MYNWDKKLISQVMVDGELVSAEAIRLSSLAAVIVPKVIVPEEPVKEPEPPVTVVQETQAERVAKILLLQKLRKESINADPNNMIVMDLNAQIYSVNGAGLEEKSKMAFAFVLNNKTDEVSELILSTEYGDYSIDGMYKLSDLKEVVLGAYEQIIQQAASG